MTGIIVGRTGSSMARPCRSEGLKDAIEIDDRWLADLRLCQFLGVVGQTGHSEGHGADHFLMLIHQCGIGFRVAGKAMLDQLGFVIGSGHMRHLTESDEWQQQFL